MAARIESEIVRVLRRIGKPLSRGQLYERARIDDITELDAGLRRLVAAGKVVADRPDPLYHLAK